MNTWLKAILIIILFSGILLAGCSGGTDQAPVIGKTAPEFQLQSLDGQSISLSSLRGKPVLINFWATWCGPCRMEMPYMQEIHDEWSGEGLVMLAINIGESSDLVGQFMKNQGLSFPVLLDMQGEVAKQYGVRAIPTTFFIDKGGIIREKKIGAFQNAKDIEGYLEKMW